MLKTGFPGRFSRVLLWAALSGPFLPGPPVAAHASQTLDWLPVARRAVVAIETLDRPAGPLEGILPLMPGEPGGGTGRGAGFRWLREGLVVTSAHVVQDALRVRVGTGDGAWWPGRLVGVDRPSDLALVAVDAWGPAEGLALADEDRLGVGDPVLAIGHPLGLEGTVTRGIVSALDRGLPIADRIDFIQTDACLQPGSSGGPLLDADGRVVGVNAAVARHLPGIGFAVPARIVRWVLPRLRAGKGIVRGQLSATWTEQTEERPWHQPSHDGVLLVAAAPGGAVARAGLRPGDRLLSLGGRAVLNPADVGRFLLCTVPGQTVDAEFTRGASRERVILTLDAVPGDDELRGQFPAYRRPTARP